MNAADLAVIAMAAVTLTDRVLEHRHRMKVADRLRIVNPVRQPEPKPKGEPETEAPGADDDKPRSILELGRTG